MFLGVKIKEMAFFFLLECAYYVAEKDYILIKTSSVNVSRCSSVVTQCDIRGRSKKVSSSCYNCRFLERDIFKCCEGFVCVCVGFFFCFQTCLCITVIFFVSPFHSRIFKCLLGLL